MKTLIYSRLCGIRFITLLFYLQIFFILSLEVNAQSIWYVNRDATGNNNGTSWTNAWKSFANVNWGSLSPGDTIYVSGGADSTTYMPSTIYGIGVGIQTSGTPSWTFASGNPVVICPAWHPGHNGGVYFATGNDSHRSLMRIGNLSNIKITGFTFVDRRVDPTVISAFISIGNGDWGDVDSLVYFENNHIISKGLTGFLYLPGSKITISNCLMEQLPNNYPHDNDPMGISSGRGGHTIRNNRIIMRNNNVGTDAHRDGIQMSNFGFGEDLGGRYATERLPMRIFNNLIIDEHPNGTSWNALIYSSGPYCNVSFYVYNNIIVSRKWNTSLSGIWIGKGGILPWTKYDNSLYILNNTIIVKGGGVGEGAVMVTAYNHDTLIVKNNIFVMDTSMRMVHNLDGADGFPFCFKVFNYNYYGIYSDPTQAFAVDNALNLSWNAWRGAPYNDDVNSTKSTNTSVVFANKYGTNFEDYYTTTGRNAGENLLSQYPFLRYDILGNERSGAWDLGALEFVGTPPSGINVKSKIFLQGPFNTNTSSMSTTLNQSSLLPNSQPYNTPPWNYNGNESFSSGPNSTMVDWVLVELRSASNPAQVVARRAAVLKNNGLLLNTSGNEGVVFNNVVPGSYYIAIYHRNHLAIMSAAPVPLSSNSAIYDFTTAMNKAYGQNAMVELVSGKFGMYASDGNADGIVNNADRDNVWLIQNGNMGYLEGDFNMNSGVTIHDVNQLWNINIGKTTQVP